MPDSTAARVLIVEDDATLRAVLCKVLERGFVGIEAGTGREALQRLSHGDIDVIVLDGLLPDVHGAALAKAVLDDPRHALLPICFLSGAASDSRELPGTGIACLVKPVMPSVLTAQLRRLLSWRDQGGSPRSERLAALQRMEQAFLVGY